MGGNGSLPELRLARPLHRRRRRKKNDETRVTERELELELKLISKRQRGWKRFLSAGVSISRSVEARRMSVSCWRGWGISDCYKDRTRSSDELDTVRSGRIDSANLVLNSSRRCALVWVGLFSVVPIWRMNWALEKREQKNHTVLTVIIGKLKEDKTNH